MLRLRGELGRADGVALALAAAALALGGAAQWGTRYGWWSAAGFALAALAFGLSARRAPDAPEPTTPPADAIPWRVFALVALGVGLCGAAALQVFHFAPPTVTHPIWVAGLLAFGAAAALAPRQASRLAPLSRGQHWALLGVCVFTAVTLVWDLGGLPTEVHGDEAEVGLDALRLLDQFNLFGAGWFELPRFHAFPSAVGLWLVGTDLTGLRAASAALGVAGVLLLFGIGRRLWSVEVGLLAALLLAGQRFYIHLSRAGYHYIDTPLISLLALWLLLRLMHERRLGAALWCGITLGLGIQTYYASRLVPLLIALSWLSFLFPAAQAGEPRRRLTRADLAGLLLIVLVALAVAAPMFAYFAHDWDAFWERTRDTSMFAPAARQHLAHGYGTDRLVEILAIQLRAALTLFNRTPDNSVQYGLDGPLLDPLSGVLFVLGLGLAALGWRQARLRALLLFVVVPLIAGAALTIDTPFYPRISGLVPFAVLAVALALRHLWQLLRDAAAGGAATIAARVALAAAATAILSVNLRTYFVDYAPMYRHSPSVEIAAFVRRHGGAGRTTYMVGGAPAFYIRHGAIAFLTHGYATRDIDRIETLLRDKPDPRRSVFVVMPQGVDLLTRLQEAFGPLDVQTHRNRRDEIAFFTAVPQADGDGLDPPELLTQSHTPGPLLARVGSGLEWLQRVATGGLIAAGVLWLGLAGFGGVRRRPPRGPGVGALREPLRSRVAR
ncbi:MAG: glycosyltransferase family 39 protein, partial [Deltaproteobacteria bacterium]|nr:glycosyltransferase family 39 protein [Deltaproteobacteria bacterium]